VTQTTPDNSIVRYIYNEANLLEHVEVNLRGEGNATTFVSNIDYNARGQRILIEYGNGASTHFAYDPQTFRPLQIFTARGASFPNDCPHPPDPPCGAQNLNYTYDPVGNITYVRDDAQQTIYFRNRQVEPGAEYTYDALYRLIEATGREHLGQITNGSTLIPLPPSPTDAPRVGLLQPGDGNAMGRYLQHYSYDAVGNILSLLHQGTGPANPGWTRTYTYREPSQLEAGKTSNRLTGTQIGSDPVEQYTYDIHGNMTTMSHLPLMFWNYRDQLQATAQQVVMNGGTPETAHYVYDATGQRLRKVTERQAAGQTSTRRAERIYLGSFELYREYGGDGSTITLERETLHIMDDKQRVALVETRTQGEDGSPAQLVRYQFSNHLGTACLELDEQARIISYEEYYPYGSSSYQAMSSSTETPKRYRYTGKERDEENGLYYHGARYYACWLGRWISCDPKHEKYAGKSSYYYALDNPILLFDPDGRDVRIHVDLSTRKITYSTVIHLYPGGNDVSFRTLSSLAEGANRRLSTLAVGETVIKKQINTQGVELDMEKLQRGSNVYMREPADPPIGKRDWRVEFNIRFQPHAQKPGAIATGDNKMIVSRMTGEEEDARAKRGRHVPESVELKKQQFDAGMLPVARSTGELLLSEQDKYGESLTSMVHGAAHFTGFDDRYVPGGLTRRDGFEADWVGVNPRAIHPQHIKDAARFALRLYSAEPFKTAAVRGLMLDETRDINDKEFPERGAAAYNERTERLHNAQINNRNVTKTIDILQR
jgi:RHS repeat-associated protein